MSSWAVLLLPASIMFVALYVTALRNRSDRTLIVLLVAGPAVAAIYFGLLVAFTNADNGLWGLLAAIYLTLPVLVAWEAGLLLGTLYRFLRQLLSIST
jgi:hypothetical protein